MSNEEAHTIVRIHGIKSKIESFREELNKDLSAEAQLGEIHETPRKPLSREPLGMDPLVYFFVSFGAHLAADVVGGFIDDIKHRAKKSGVQAEQQPSTQLDQKSKQAKDGGES